MALRHTAHRGGARGPNPRPSGRRPSARPLTVIILALTLIAAACSGEAAPPTTVATSTTTTSPPATTTTQLPTTTAATIPYAALDVAVAGDAAAEAAVQAFYTWFGDRTVPQPNIPEGLLDHLTDYHPTESASFTGELFSAPIADMGDAGVVVVENQDVILLVDDGGGWRVVGAWLFQYDIDPWAGTPLRYVFVIGTDARPGEFQTHLRADSLHILASNIVEGSGGLLGIPRDLRVEASYGVDKFTNVNALVFTLTCGRLSGSDEACDDPNAGQDEMVRIASDFSGLPIEGWIVTGFLGFRLLIDAFGGVDVDVPVRMAEPNSEAYLFEGLQTLFGEDALAFSRNRKQFGGIGDWVRSLHQGMLILGSLDKILERDITALPELLAMLMENTWTDLSLEDMFTMAAGAFLLDPALIGNEVVPATGGLQGGVYYANFTEDAEGIFRDLDDGSLTPSDSWLKGRYGDSD